MRTRIYAVTVDGKLRLIRAGNKARAIAHAVRTSVEAQLASQETLLVNIMKGVEVEDAKEDDDGEENTGRLAA